MLWILIWIILCIFSKDIVYIFLILSGELDSEVSKYTVEYWTILFKFSALYIFWWMIWQILIVFKKRKAQLFMATVILIMNIILDYIFVKYFNYWVSWIAYATIITWIFTLIFGLYYILVKEKIVNFTTNIKLQNFKKFLSFASTIFTVMFLTMLAIMVDNYFFWKIWTESLASYSIWTKLKDLVFYPIIAGSIAFSVIYWFYFWKKDEKTLKKLLSWILKIWLIYGIILFILMPIIWKIFWWVFTNNKIVIEYLMIYMLFSPIFLIGFIFRFIYSWILQIRSYHKTRILLNLLFLIFTLILEYIFYNIYWTYTWIWIWAVIASLLVTFLTYLFYKIKVEKI